MSTPLGQAGDAEDLRLRMAQIRRKLPQDMERIVSGARQIVDWKQYVRDFPWATTLTAVVVGYWLVPSTRRVARPVASAAERPVQPPEPPPQPSVSRPVLAGGLLAMAGHVLLRTSINYVGQQVGQVLQQQLIKHSQIAPKPQAEPCSPQTHASRTHSPNPLPQRQQPRTAPPHSANGLRRG